MTVWFEMDLLKKIFLKGDLFLIPWFWTPQPMEVSQTPQGGAMGLSFHEGMCLIFRELRLAAS